jgi:hypothetical protein
MRAQKVLAREFQFYFSDLDNIVLVECHEDERVTVRASKNNVPEERKIFFIRKLAAEGFIPDSYQWFSGSTDGSNGVLWIKDYSWLKTHQPSNRQATRVMCRLFVGACVLLACMFRVLIVSPNNSTVAARNPSAVIAGATPGIALQPRTDSLVPGKPLAELQGQHQPVSDHDAAGNPPLGAAVLEQHRANNLDQH